jgi:ABC-type branched-subunit amino acid transport system ATPase component
MSCGSQIGTQAMVDKNFCALLPLAQRHYIIHKGEICWSGTSSELKQSLAMLDRYITLQGEEE